MSTENETRTDLKGKEFDEVSELLKSEAQVRGTVQKKDPTSGKWSYCLDFTPHDYDEAELLAIISAEFGPGEYPVQFKAASKKGPPVIRWQKNYNVQARRLSAAQRETAPAKNSDDAIALALESNNRLLASLVDKISQPAPAAPAPPSLGDMAKELLAVKELFGGEKKSGVETIKEALELVTLMREAGGGGDDDVMSQAIKYFGPLIAKGSETLHANEAARPAKNTDHLAPGAAPSPTQAAHTPAPPGPTPASDLQQNAAVEIDQAFAFFNAEYLTAVMQLAEAGEDPQHVGQYLARLVGRDTRSLDVAGIVISQDDMVERLALANAGVMPFAEWFDSTADWLAHALWPATNGPPGAENATNTATTGESGDSTGINGGESSTDLNGEDLDNEEVAGGGAISDATVHDSSRAGPDHDA